MKPLFLSQVIVLVALSVVGGLCLSSHPPDVFLSQMNTDLYAEGIRKLEGASPFGGKENLVALVRELADAKVAAQQAGAAQARLIRQTGLLALVLAGIQAVSIWLARK